MERTYEAPSNEAPHMILGYHQGRLVTYLQHHFNFSSMATGQAKNRHVVVSNCFLTTVRFSQSELLLTSSDGTVASSKDVERILLHCFSRLVIHYFLSVFYGLFLCTRDAFHNKIRNDVSEQVCACVCNV